MTASAPLAIRRHKSKARLYTEKLSESVTLDMVYIPSGKFMMGAPETEESSTDDERPQHFVTVPAFFMGQYPITQAQYKAIMETNPSGFKDKPDSDRRPVENVSWDGANEFCKRLSDRTNREYQLPSEAQWEYACRAGTSTPFHFGKTISTELANYYDYGSSTYANGEKGVYRKETTPIGDFGVANEFGLSDMHGNVLEWCLDTWHKNYEGAPTDGSAWTELNKTSHILRGGSWINDPPHCRSACRGYTELDNRNDPFGFRVLSHAPGLTFPSAL